MYLFIDANIFLSFYHLTSEDLAELEKLAVLIQNKEIDLLLPQQIIDETWRNRASKINDSLQAFKKTRFSIPYPAYCKDYQQYEKMRKHQKILEDYHSEMIKLIQRDIDLKELKADKLLIRLFDLGNVIERTPEIIYKARERIDIGNPPGKKNSLGDAVNWESLLSATPKHFSLNLIADDSDFYSPLDSGKLNEFLYDEWHTAKETKIIFYRRLSDFFKIHFKDINLETELEKDQLIEQLSGSGSFANTHAVIAKLSRYSGFTQKQVEDIIQALLLNNQISMIVDDDDVHEFYKHIYDEYFFSIMEYYDELEEMLRINKPKIEKEDDEIPF